MDINYESYRIFYYVAKHRSFTRAAEILRGSQPNITRTIKNLETVLGCRLFVRSNKGVRLTAEGERLFARVSVAVEQIQAGEQELEADTRLESGVVFIGASEIALHLLLLPVLRRFHRAYPKVKVRLSNFSTGDAIAAVKNGAVDFAVVSTPAQIDPPLSATKLMDYQDILVAGPAYEFLAHKRQTLDSLSQYPLVCLGKKTQSYAFFSSLYAHHGLSIDVAMEAATTDQILPMIRHDLGVGFLPEQMAGQALAEGEVFQVHLEETVPPRAVSLIQDPTRGRSLVVRELEKYLRQVAQME